MPPRTVKRGGAASSQKRAARSSSKRAQSQQDAPAEEPPVAKVEEVKEEVVVVAGERGSVLEKRPEVEEKPPVVVEPVVEERSRPEVARANGSVPLMKEDEVKESVDDYGKDERLDLEYNDPEYEPEEYDDKEMEQDDVHDLAVEGEEEHEEEHLVEEEEGDMMEEELEDVHEELEGEEDEDHQDEDPEHQETLDGEEDDHHDVFKERRKRKEFEVFVGGLDKDATEDDLRKVFSAVGEVTEVRLMMNPQTRKNKGFAFLRFATVEQARRAVTDLRNPVIKGKQCGVTPSQDSDTLFLGNICKTWTKEALKEKLKHYGVENVEDVTLVEDGNNEGMNRGFAFLEFSSRSEAMDAFKRLQKRDVLFGVDRPAKVSFADSFIDPGDEIMAQVKTVFVDGLPASWDEDRVRELLKKYGEVEKVELARNMPSAKRRDFGFVTFDTHDAAVTCAKSINNSELGEGDSKAKVRARLSRPLQRGKGKYSSRGDMRSTRVVGRPSRGSWSRPAIRSFPARGIRGIGGRIPSASLKRPVAIRDRRPVMAVPPRARPLPPPTRSYDRRPPVPSYSRSSLKREYTRREELPPPRSRVPADYGSRIVPERRVAYRDDYPVRESGYTDLHRSTSRPAARRDYPDESYGQRFERHPSYREARARDYESVSGSKRPYSAVDDVSPRYADPGVRPSRARLDYELGGISSHYSDAYGDRHGRSSMGYGGSRSSMSSMSGQDSHGYYGSRHQSMGYGGSYGSSDAGGAYSSGYSEYMSRGNNVGGSSYSSMYSSRSGGGNNYMGPGSSGSYY
ncbi:hypothetical protein EUGRSUZ_D01204 [Eucalyptus grandis]|uniref:RRM domain-containing protein n=3 Tax=Eucalyptus grandis TaxID=71139 RepID=A0A059CG04_EUCGR|nr:hypothetical protein EUGRSUZ_D01204 [Eucalyptus grandis]KAK3433923.1 hypothetical protein EUGRSUZ_D01204 [Eucalyptus grandis]